MNLDVADRRDDGSVGVVPLCLPCTCAYPAAFWATTGGLPLPSLPLGLQARQTLLLNLATYKRRNNSTELLSCSAPLGQ